VCPATHSHGNPGPTDDEFAGHDTRHNPRAESGPHGMNASSTCPECAPSAGSIKLFSAVAGPSCAYAYLVVDETEGVADAFPARMIFLAEPNLNACQRLSRSFRALRVRVQSTLKRGASVRSPSPPVAKSGVPPCTFLSTRTSQGPGRSQS